MFPIVHNHRDRALEGRCLAIPTHLSHQTKPYIKILFLKNHLNHPGQCRVTQASTPYMRNVNEILNQLKIQY